MDIRKLINEEVLFSKEAAAYLEISVQRLSKLVSTGEVIPVKKCESGTIFLKRDLELRKLNSGKIGKEVYDFKSFEKFKIDKPYMIVAINYFTVQSYFSYAQKKTIKPFLDLGKIINIKEPLYKELEAVVKFLGTSEEELMQRFEHIYRGIEKLGKDDIILNFDHFDYPFKLKRVENSPPFLFARGRTELLKSNIGSIIGPKNPTEEEENWAYRITQYLGDFGFVLASGLSNGIEKVVVETCMNKNYPLIGVLGTPINVVYPLRNEKIQKEVAKNGLIISQYAPNTPVKRWQFPIRNYTLSGISDFTVVVDLNCHEGNYKQIEYALKQGRIVFLPFPRINVADDSWINKFLRKPGVIFYKSLDDFKEKFKSIMEFS